MTLTPGLQEIRCLPLSISITKCPLTLWLNVSVACDEEYNLNLNQSLFVLSLTQNKIYNNENDKGKK